MTMFLRCSFAVILLVHLSAGGAYASSDPCHDCIERGDYETAIGVCSEMIRMTSGSAMNMAACYNNRGLAYMSLGRYDQAMSDFNTSLDANPNNYGALANRGLTHMYRGKYPEAVKDITAAMEIGPKDARLYANRGKAYFEMGKYGKALSDLDSAIEMNKYVPEYFIVRGLLNKYLGYDGYALKDFESAIEGNPGFEYAYLLAISTAWRVSGEDYEKSVGRLKDYMTDNPSGDWARSLSKYYTGMMTEEELLDIAGREDDPDRQSGRLCEAYYYIGEERLRKGDEEGAVEFFRKSVATTRTGYTEFTNSVFMLKLLEDMKR